MRVEIQITPEPIPEHLAPPADPELGSWLEFRGLVRGLEAAHRITALEYEAYERMAARTMRNILEALAPAHPCRLARVIHRTGVVRVGETAIYVGIASSHRGEGIGLLTAFMERLKQETPIWKTRALSAATFSPTPNSPISAAPSQATLPTPAPASAADVFAGLRAWCLPLAPERCPLAAALGRVLREPVVAPEDQPSCDRSTVDGYAVPQDSTATSFRVVDRIRAGDWKPRVLRLDEAVRVATGAALPGPNLRVVLQEHVETAQHEVRVIEPDSDSHVRRRGEEARAGRLLLGEGLVLRPGALALLASLGVTRPLVSRRPRVLHLATGDEIVSPESIPTAGQIRDSNSVLVAAFLERWGIVPDHQRVGEDRSALQTALCSAGDAMDLVLISGGASVGDHDFTREVLGRAGFVIHVQRTKVRPGKPLIVAQRGSAMAFGLPGNPLAHFVCLNLFVRAALDAWSGRVDPWRFNLGQLEVDLADCGSDRETFWPARADLREETTLLLPLPWASSGDLTSLALANALIRLPAGHGPLNRGHRLEFVSVEKAL